MKVVISGYYGFGNLGDEALLAAIIQGLRRRVPAVRPLVLSGDPRRTRAEHGVEAVPRARPLAVAAALRGAALLLSGSGSLIQDVTGPFNAPYYLGVIALARRLGVPAMIFAQGVGPLRGRLARWLAARVLNRVQVITVRDPASRAALAELGVDVPVEVTADPALALDPRAWLDDLGGRVGAAALPQLPAGPYLAVNVRRRGLSGEGARRLAAALTRVAATTGAVPVFLPMQVPEDVAAARAVLAAVPAAAWPRGARPVLVDGPLTLAQLLAALAGAEAVLAMRLHALILGALVERAPLGLSYDPKVDAFLAQVGLRPVAHCQRLPEPGALAEAVLAAWAARQAWAAGVHAALPPLRAAAWRNFDRAVALLGLSADVDAGAPAS